MAEFRPRPQPAPRRGVAVSLNLAPLIRKSLACLAIFIAFYYFWQLGFQDLNPAKERVAYFLSAPESDLSRRAIDTLRSGFWLDPFDRATAEHAQPASGSSILTIPVSGQIRVGFGWQSSPVNGSRYFHPGIDIAAAGGTPVKACLGGKVTAITGSGGMAPGTGRTVELTHPGSLVSYYANLGEVLVSVGQEVKQGEVIGKVAGSDKSGVYFHFELRDATGAIDPLSRLAWPAQM